MMAMVMVMVMEYNDDINGEYKIILVVFLKNLWGEFIRPSHTARFPIPSLLIQSLLPLGVGQERFE